MTESELTPPTALPVVAENIPAELKAYPQWVVWAWWHDGKKWTKPLLNPHQPMFEGRENYAKTNDSRTWTTFAKALAMCRDHPERLAGVGYVFAEADPFTGLDLDKCRNPDTGELEPWASAHLREFTSYAELSPSGRGVKVILKARLPAQGKKYGQREVYDRRRYFTVTGHHVEGTPRTIEARQDQAAAFYGNKAYFPDKERPDQARRPEEVRPCTVPDGEIVARAKAAKNGEKFARLWAGDTSDYGGDQSSADQALCNHLAFWTDGDEEAIDRLFRESGLFRGKWERDDYRERTIGNAVAALEDGYSPNPVGLTDAECRELFEAGPKAPESVRVRASVQEFRGDELGSPEQPAPVVVQAAVAPALRVDAYTQAQAAAAAYQAGQPRHIRGIKLSDLFAMPDPEWLVKRHFHKGTLVVVYGEPGSFKTFYSLDLALTVATGRPFAGAYGVAQGEVLYIAAEGVAGLKRRAMAWVKAKNGGVVPGTFTLIGSRIDLTSLESEDIDQLKRVVLEDMGGRNPALIVIDTMARVFHGDENTASDVGKFVQVADFIRELTGATVQVVHHTGKDPAKGARGSTALLGAADTMLHLEKSDKGFLVSNTKQKDSEQLAEYIMLPCPVLVRPDAEDEFDRHSLVFKLQAEATTAHQLLNAQHKRFLAFCVATFPAASFKLSDTGEAADEKAEPIRKTTRNRYLEVLVEKGFLTRDGMLYKVANRAYELPG